jgi:hypothetical protein
MKHDKRARAIRTAALAKWARQCRALGELIPEDAMRAQTRAMTLIGPELEARSLAGENADEIVAATVRAHPAAFGLTGQLRGGESTEQVWRLIERVGARLDEERAADRRRRQRVDAAPSAN